MRHPSRWQRLRDVILSTEPRRRTLVSMALLALLLMTGSAGVMLLVAHANVAVNATAVQWWAAMSVGGLVVMTAFIRSGATARLRDPSLTIPQMVWTLTSGAVAYVLAGEARGLVPSVLAMILFFGTFGLTVAEVIGIGIYALLAFACAIGATTRFSANPFGYLDTAYALMVAIVLGGCVALNLRIQRIRAKLQQQREALAQALDINRELATRDELTGLINRRAMLDLMALEHRRSLRNHRPLVLAQLDIDHFKPINDQHGHATGDRALQAFAGTVRATVRGTDVLARWGGEEFVLMLADTQLDDARELLERIRLAVERLEIPHATGSFQMSVSAGLALHLPGDTVEHTLERADQALYTAKALGRNRVVVANRPAATVPPLNARA
ncbi:diguanylate cyclase (GGDEF)-like protein [Acidovorax sp. 69]|uniref:GGDEF domain-containing protein n=1 Tax=Acidovorax sp. 69 TaxID=2035202 RepID=UPI000CB16590|nr:GGDEF domain-containing protein [Acidovorax sp. 69]PJI95480.1 diguanylate cyclase (GGDEF)-like protein [Acidovorax sp. 69]